MDACCIAAVVIGIIIGGIYILIKFATPISIWSAGRNVRKGLQDQKQEQTVIYQQPPPQHYPPQDQQPHQPQYQQPQGTCPRCGGVTNWDPNSGRYYCPHCQVFI